MEHTQRFSKSEITVKGLHRRPLLPETLSRERRHEISLSVVYFFLESSTPDPNFVPK